MEFKDYYQVLGVAEAATAAELKTAYRKLARKYHPDVSKETDAEAKFKEVNEAYEVLKDPQKKTEYDQMRQYRASAGAGAGAFEPPPGWESSADFAGGGFTGADAGQFSEFFESIFGGGARAHRSGGFRQADFRQRGEDLHYRIALFLEEAQQGAQRQITLNLPTVDADGRVSQQEKTLSVKIPAGVAAGQHIRLAGQGAPGSGGAPAGDLFLEIEFAPHPYFSVDGKNIVLTLPVSSWEAALGATVAVPTLSGKVNLKIPKGSSSGDKLRLKGRGLAGDPPGDQLVVLQVTLPKQHDAESEALYKQLAEREAAFDPRAQWEARS